MANQKHLKILKRGVETWNQWRKQHSDIIFPDLSNANFSGAQLWGAILIQALLMHADLSRAQLGGAQFWQADLRGADLNRADLSHADLMQADLSGAHLWGANLSGANLTFARLVETNLAEATLTNCKIYGISAWKVELQGAIQNDLVITPDFEPTITVDNLKIAQFIYLLLNNAEIRDVIDTITSKVVLILGRFTDERKKILDALRDELRKRNFSPVIFDFEKPTSRDFTETVSTLAHLARFIIADLTEPSSIPLELQAIVPDLAVPVQPLFKVSQESKHEFSMFQDLSKKYNWVLPIFHYTDQTSLLQSLKENVIDPAEQKAQELAKR